MFTLLQKEITLDAEEGQCVHKLRTFIYVDKVERTGKKVETVTIEGTRDIHCVKSIGETGIVMFRNLACACESSQCMGPNECDCINAEYVEPWTKADFRKLTPTQRKSKVYPSDKPYPKKYVSQKKNSSKKRATSSCDASLLPSKKPKKTTDKSVPAQPDKTNPNSKTTSRKSSPCVDELSMPTAEKTTDKSAPPQRMKPTSNSKGKTTSRKRSSRGDELSMSAVEHTGNSSASQPEKSSSRTKAASPRKRQLSTDPYTGDDVKKLFVKETSAPVSAWSTRRYLASLKKSSPKDLSSKCNKIGQKLNAIVVRTDLSILGLGSDVDVQASSLVPPDLRLGQGLLPIEIVGDGNCLPRCGSVIAYGTQAHHLEIRLRIAIEMVQYRDLYLDNDYLGRGITVTGINNLAQRLAQFSAEHVTQDVLTPNKISEIYSEEIQSVLTRGTPMSMWQILAMSSVLEVPLFSVYPQMGSNAVRNDLHRLVLPRQTSDAIKPVFYIMWTSKREDMRDEYWVANHFVPLLPVLSRGSGEGTE